MERTVPKTPVPAYPDTTRSFASEAEELAYLRKVVRQSENRIMSLEASNKDLEASNKDLEKSRKSLEASKKSLETRVLELQQQVDYWTKRFFGRMSEKRHLPLDPSQLSLFSAEELAQMSAEEQKSVEEDGLRQEEVIERTVRTRQRPKRRSLETTGLPVVSSHLWPEGTTDGEGNLLSDYIEVGTENTDRIETVRAKAYISRLVRHKVMRRSDIIRNPEERDILTPALPRMAIEKGMAGASLLTDIVIDKFLYHLPFYRQINRYRECGLRIPASTMDGWYETAVESLHVLYKLLRSQVMASEYIQVDESVVPVIDNEKHRARKGYEWCVRDGITGALFFWYDRGSRSKKTARELLGGYRGTFQSDGYEAYDQFCGVNGVLGAACWAHARRKFVDALREDKKLASQAIALIGKLYAVEDEADKAGVDPDGRKELRRRKSYPVIRLIEKWCVDTYATVLEKSLMGKAIAYTYSLIDRLAVYVNDGRVNIDNNLIENAIRPLALGRKNWLFCGNDASAYRAAIVYSLIASCRAADVDPREWMEYVLVEIPYRKETNLPMDDLLPAAYAAKPGIKRWNIPDPE